MGFIKKNRTLIMLLCISLSLTLFGAFNKSISITIIGAFLSFTISLYRAYKSYQSNQKLKKQIDSTDEALGITRDSEGRVTGTALDWEEL